MLRKLNSQFYFLGLFFGLLGASHAQTVTATLPTGVLPFDVAVNPITNKIYVVNDSGSSVSVIDGATNLISTVPTGAGPEFIAVNSATNKIYVSNNMSGSITVIDGATNATVNVPLSLSSGAAQVAINPVTNKIYVSETNINAVAEIDGKSNTVVTIPVGGQPGSLAVNPLTNKVYVPNRLDNNVTVIDGLTHGTVTIATGQSPLAVAVDVVRNRIYVANSVGANVTVINGSNNSATAIAAGSGATAIAVNPGTNKIYTANGSTKDVTVIDGATGLTDTVSTGGISATLAINTTTNKIYAANSSGNYVTVIDGATDSTSTINIGSRVGTVAVNPITNKAYVTRPVNNDVAVVDCSTYASITAASSAEAGGIALNPVTNRLYLSDYATNSVMDADGNTLTSVSVPVGRDPVGIAVNPITNKVYVSNFDDANVSVIDGATFTTSAVFNTLFPEPGPIAINPVTNTIYVAESCCGGIEIIDGATSGFVALNLGTDVGTVLAVVVNPVTNKVYVQTFAGIQVIDGITKDITSIPLVTSDLVPGQTMAVNTLTNRIYVIHDGALSVIDGVTNTVTALPVNINAAAVAVNELTNKLYVAGSTTGLTVVDLDTSVATALFLPGQPGQIAINAATNKIYVGGNAWNEIDGISNAIHTLATTAPYFYGLVAVNPITSQIYMAVNFGGGPVNIINEQQIQAQALPLTVNISSLPGNQTSNPTPSFTFSALSASGTTPTGVYFQVDTKQKAWTAANGSNPSFTGTVAALNPGLHTIYAYAVDGQEATSTQTSAPLIGTIQAYTFLVTPAAPSTPVNTSSTPFITSQTPGPLRNNFSGYVGFEFTVGSAPLQVSSVGRIIAPGNSEAHIVKLVQASGVDVPNGSATVSAVGQSGQFAYAALSTPVTLQANSTYFLVSQESSGGDQWYDIGGVTSTGVASVLAPTYTNSAGAYVPVPGLSGRSYGPLNFLYTASTSSSPALSVSITSPQQGATLFGSVTVSVSTSGAVTNLQLQVDGLNQGAANSLTLTTTLLTNGTHTLTVVASDSQGDSATSAGVSVTVSNSTSVSPSNGTSFVTSQTPGPLRNNYKGFVGFSFTTGSTPVVINSLGRYEAPGDSASHLLKLVDSSGTDVPGGSVSISLSGGVAGTYLYGSLSTAITLQPNTSYYLVSQETSGGDQWYDIGSISVTGVATVNAPVYVDASGNYISVPGLSGMSYGPLSFLYGASTAAPTLSATITTPQAGASVSGTISIQVTTTGQPTSFQLQVDGANQGAAISSNALSLNTTTLSNGTHTLSVVVSDGQTSAVSPSVSVNVSNGAPTQTQFITAQTPSTLRNNYSGYVGMAIQVGANPLTVTSLARLFPAGQAGTHMLKLVQANGVDLPNGSVSVTGQAASSDGYVVAQLATPVVLQANTIYYLVSSETYGGDYWYDLEPVVPTSAATVQGAVYTDNLGNYVTVQGLLNYSYGPLNFQYH